MYFNDLADLYGLDYTTHKTGNIMSASLGGEKLATAKPAKYFVITKFWETLV